MASVQYLFSYSKTFTRELVAAQTHLTEATNYRITFAITIQKTWRGYAAWKKYQHVRRAIITIQAYFHGWQVRSRRKLYVAQHANAMVNLRLQRAAIKIQAWWRGTIVRRLLRDRLPGARIAERARIQAANDEMATLMRQVFEDNARSSAVKSECEAQQDALIILYKCHHLLRTEVRPGIYSCLCSDDSGDTVLSLIELLMKALPCKEYMDSLRKLYYELHAVPKTRTNLFNTRVLSRLENLVALSADNVPRPPKEFEYNILRHAKTFNLSTKVPKKPIVTSIFTKPCSRPVRVKDAKLVQREKKFELTQRLDLRNREQPYHIDYWEKEIFGQGNRTAGC